ncbi:MAG: hypothetical protein IJS22_01025 [Lachnospiraceae bacterium]|nr:hypothetical protein [Lachnospiraceae bacterium]
MKRLLTVILSAVMTLSLVTVARADGDRCICGAPGGVHLDGCDGTLQTWETWTDTATLPKTTGYYALGTDVTVDTTVEVTANNSDIYLDLNGHTVSSSTRIYNLAKDAAVSLTVLDSTGSGSVVMTDYTGGGTFAVIGNNGNKTLTIYGGTFDVSAISATGGSGSFVRATSTGTYTCTVNIHGGTVRGGSTGTDRPGGTIYVKGAGSTLNITGGSVTGGSTKNGGNVYADGASVVMSGGEVTGGSATLGGNVYLINGASMTMTGGSITGGSCTDGGGNVLVNASSMTMTGGVISGGSAPTGGNIRIQNAASTLTMTGGEIFGGTTEGGSNPRGGNILNNAATVIISGAAKVYDGVGKTDEYGDGNIYTIGSGTTTAEDGCVFFSSHDYCICGKPGGVHLEGCDGTVHTWTAWTDSANFPSSSGYWYLDTDLTLTAMTNIKKTADIYIDLNGHTVTGPEARMILLNDEDVSLTIMDSEGGGRVIPRGNVGGAFVQLVNKGNKTLTIYGGTYDASAVTISSGRGGSLISTNANTRTATVNIHGGTLIGGTVSGSYNGGTICMQMGSGTSSVLNMTGGTVTGGSTRQHGGNIALEKGTVMNMSGGLVTGGTAGYNNPSGAAGGNIAVLGGTFNMTGGKLADGRASTGGNVSVTVLETVPGTATISGGEIEGGVADERGGNIYNSSASVTVSGPARIHDGYASVSGLNIHTWNDGVTDTEGADSQPYFTKWDKADMGVAIALNDGIDIMFCVENITNNPARYSIEYSFGGQEGTASIRSAESNSVTVASGTAVQMTESAVVSFSYLGEKILSYPLSVKDYCDRQIASDTAGESLKALCRAVLTYGEASQLYFGSNTDSLPTAVNAAEDLSDRTAAGIVITDALNKYSDERTGAPLVTAYATLALTSRPQLVYKIEALPGVDMDELDISVSRGGAVIPEGEDLEITKDGSSAVIRVKAIYVTDLDSAYTLTVSRGSDSRSITYSALSYIFRKQSTDNAALDYVCRALHNYYNKAMAYSRGETCICGGKNGTHLPGCDGQARTWMAWTDTASLPVESGYWYLENDVTLAQTAVVSSNADIYLDLAGRVVTSPTRVYDLARSCTASLTVLDTSGRARVVMKDYAEGGSFAVIGNTGNKTLTVYGGTFDASAINAAGKNGAFARVGSSSSDSITARINVYGGKIIGGTAENGGAVYLQKDGALEMTGGVIEGGKAVLGGNIFNNGGQVTVSGDAKVRNGEASDLGSNIYSRGDTYTANVTESCLSLSGTDAIGLYPAETQLLVGYSKKSITPTADQQSAGILLGGGACEGFYDDIYVTTTAFEDSEGNRYFHVATDLSWGGMADSNNLTTSKGVADMVRRVLRDELGIDPELVTVGGIHNHSQVNYSSDEAPNAQWREQVLLPQVVASAQEAIADLAPATVSTGSTETQNLTFVRRYIGSDGKLYDSQTGSPTDPSVTLTHEKEADEEIQMVRIDRDGKSTILMVNWQSHATMVSSKGTYVCADFVGPLRDKVENDLGVSCVFFQGACGNLAPTSFIAGDGPYSSLRGWIAAQNLGRAVAQYVVDAYNSGTCFASARTGLIRRLQYNMTAQVNKPSEEDYQKALQGEFWPERLNNTYIDNYRAPSYKDLELNAVSIGDVAFVTLPTEFCDTLGEAIKDGSPFATTVLLGYTCSKGRYMQDLASVPNGGYEVYYSWFVPGTGEAAVEYYLNTLGTFYPVRAGK